MRVLNDWLMDRLHEDEVGLREWLGNLPADSAAAEWIRQWVADIDAKRRILGISDYRAQHPDLSGSYALEDVLKLLALPYADRPGYRERWRS